MRNSKSAYLFTYNNIWKLVSISIINAVSIKAETNIPNIRIFVRND